MAGQVRRRTVFEPNMGRHCVALFGLALAALLTVDGAAAASKSAPRAGSRRSVSKPGGRPIRTPRYREEDEDVDDYGRLEDAGRMKRSRPKSKRTDDRHSSSHSRPSSRSSPSRSNSRSTQIFIKCRSLDDHAPYTCQYFVPLLSTLLLTQAASEQQAALAVDADEEPPRKF